MLSRLRRFENALLGTVRPPAEILDFGCGSGDISAHLAGLGYTLTGVDVSEGMIARAAKRYTARNLRFMHIPRNRPQLDFADGYFRVCVCSSVLEYALALDGCLTQLRRVVATDGTLFATVPNVVHPVRIVEQIEKIVGNSLSRKMPRVAKDRLEYLNASLNRFTLDGWRKVMASSGWAVKSVKGWALDPLLLIVAQTCSTRESGS
jgi:ubiquinone/menaquinone biosynthesis C-methylase UbiE